MLEYGIQNTLILQQIKWYLYLKLNKVRQFRLVKSPTSLRFLIILINNLI